MASAPVSALPPLSIVSLPANTLVGFKALPGWSSDPLEQYYHVREAYAAGGNMPTATPKEGLLARVKGALSGLVPTRTEKEDKFVFADWAGIYSQISLRSAVNYLSNQWERGADRAQIAAIYVGSDKANVAVAGNGSAATSLTARGADEPPLQVLVCRDPSIGDGSVPWPEKSHRLRTQLWAEREQLAQQLLRQPHAPHANRETGEVITRESVLAALEKICRSMPVGNGDVPPPIASSCVSLPPLVQSIGELLNVALFIADYAESGDNGNSVHTDLTGQKKTVCPDAGIGYELILPHCMMRRLRTVQLARFEPRQDIPLVTGAVYVKRDSTMDEDSGGNKGAATAATAITETPETRDEVDFIRLKCHPAIAADPGSLADYLCEDGVLHHPVSADALLDLTV